MTDRNRDDRRLGTLAIQAGLIDSTALQQSLATLEKRRRSGQQASLGKILIEQGHLTADHLRSLLGDQGKEVLACVNPGCGRKFRIRNYRPGRSYRCKACGDGLGYQSDATCAIDVDEEAGDSASVLMVNIHDSTSSDGSLLARREAPGESRGNFHRYLDPIELSRGGMGRVLKATDPELGRTVAIKTILDQDRMGEEGLARFLREARITGQLGHPNIPPVHELSRTPEGELFFSMKLIGGSSLAEEIERASSIDAPEERLRIRKRHLDAFLKICDAVAFAHSRGVIHRDLKPANIMMGEFGEVLVLDWGIARLTGDEIEEGPTSATGTGWSSSLPEATLDGTLLGTPAYMSPEQAEGDQEKIDERTDVYSLGAVLYEILTLQAPYEGDSIASLLARVIGGDLVPPSKRAPSGRIPTDMDAVVLKAMARGRGRRYAGVDDLRSDVETYLHGGLLAAARYTPLQRAMKWARLHRTAALGAAAALLALVVGLVAMVMVQRAHLIHEAEGIHDTAECSWQDAEATAPFNRAAPGQYFRSRIATLGELGRAVERHPDPPPAWREALAERAGHLQAQALEAGDWALALILAEMPASWGVIDEGERETRLARVAQAEAEAARLDRDRLRAALKRIEEAEQRGQKQGGLVPGEILERSRRLARISGRAATVEALDLLGGTGMELKSPLARHFLIDFLGRKGDVITSTGGLTTQGLISRTLEGDLGGIGAEELRSWLLAAARVEAVAPEEMGDVERFLGPLEDEALPGGPVSNHVEAARQCLALRRGDWDLSSPGNDHEQFARQLDELADHVASDVRSGSAHTSFLLGLLEGHLDLSTFQLSLVCDQIGLLGDSSPPDPACPGTHPRGIMIELIQKLVDEERLEQEGGDVDLGERSRRFDLLVNLSMNLSRLGADASLPLLFELRELGGTGSVMKSRMMLPFILLSMDGWPEPEDAEGFLVRGIAFHIRGESGEAISDLTRAIEIAPHFATAHGYRGSCWDDRGDEDRARADYERALRQDARCLSALLGLADLRAREGDLSGAIDLMNRALEFYPHEVGLLIKRSRYRKMRGDLTGALADLDRTIEINPMVPLAYNSRGLLRKAGGRREEALEDFTRALALDPGYRPARDNRSVLRTAMGDPEGAIEDCTFLIESNPLEPGAFLNRGGARLQMDQPEEAINDYSRALELAPEMAIAYSSRGAALHKLGRLPEALADYDRAIEIDPRSFRSHVNRGALKAGKGDFKGALADCDRAIECEPDNALAYANRGIIGRHAGKRTEARADLDRAIELDPGNSAHYYQRGILLQESGDLRGALADYESSLARDPGNCEARVNQALILRAQGKKEAAERAFQEALRHASAGQREAIERVMQRTRGE